MAKINRRFDLYTLYSMYSTKNPYVVQPKNGCIKFSHKSQATARKIAGA